MKVLCTQENPIIENTAIGRALVNAANTLLQKRSPAWACNGIFFMECENFGSCCRASTSPLQSSSLGQNEAAESFSWGRNKAGSSSRTGTGDLQWRRPWLQPTAEPVSGGLHDAGWAAAWMLDLSVTAPRSSSHFHSEPMLFGLALVFLLGSEQVFPFHRFKKGPS